MNRCLPPKYDRKDSCEGKNNHQEAGSKFWNGNTWSTSDSNESCVRGQGHVRHIATRSKHHISCGAPRLEYCILVVGNEHDDVALAGVQQNALALG